VKRRREEEIDVVYDLSSQYPPLSAPSRPTLNVGEIKTLLVAATAAGEEVKPLLDEPNMDPKLKAFGKFAMSLFKVVEAMVENGLVPMANGETTATGAAALSTRSARGPPVPPKAPGVKELRDTLEKAERESILFDADLGPNPLGNRSGLATALSGGIRNSAIQNACDRGADPAEAARWDASPKWTSSVSDPKKVSQGRDRPPNSYSSTRKKTTVQCRSNSNSTTETPECILKEQLKMSAT
jgi:hypothetical protein